MRRLIIEPHADDALFSLSSIFQMNNGTIDILTCCTHEDGRSSERLVDLPQISSVTQLDWSESNYHWSKKSFTHHDVNRLPSNVNSYQWTRDKIKEAIPTYESDLEKFEKDVLEFYHTMEVNEDVNYWSEIYVPIGVVHPWHVFTSEVIRKCLTSRIIFYAERPYTHKKFTKRIIQDFLTYHYADRMTMLRNLEYNGSIKEEMINKFYPGELQGFHWDRDKILELPEMIIEYK